MKKKFRFSIILLIICLVTLLLVGCGSKPNTPPSEPNPPATEPEPEPGEEPGEDPGEEPEDPSEEPSEEPEEPEEEEDPLAILLASEEFARENEGDFFVKRADTLYSINNKTEGCYLYTRWVNELIVESIGDVPILQLEPGDEIISFSSSSIPELRLAEVEFIGNSVSMWPVGGTKSISIEKKNPNTDTIYLDKLYDVQIRDSSGNQIDGNFESLVYGDEYTISWSEGTMKNEVVLPAVCLCYKYINGNPGANYNFLINGEPTSGGYAVYDLSGVSPGIYATLTNGLIEIP